MDIYEYAMQMEKDGEDFYRRIAAETSDKGLKTIVNMLADDELKHYKTIAMMKTSNAQMRETRILDNAKNIFSEMKDSANLFDENSDQIDVYEAAWELEEKSRLFYAEKAGQVENENNKKIFMRMAEEEKQHADLLTGIIEFVSEPRQWLEDAEWNDLKQY